MSDAMAPGEIGLLAGKNWSSTVGAVAALSDEAASLVHSWVRRAVSEGELPTDIKAVFDDACRELLERFSDYEQARADFWTGFVQAVRTWAVEQEIETDGRTLGADS